MVLEIIWPVTNNSIHWMVKNKVISIEHGKQLTQMVERTVNKQHECASPRSSLSTTSSILTTMRLNRLTDETAFDSEEADIKSPFDPSPIEEIAALRRENRELLTQIEELKKGQNELKEQMQDLTRQMNALMERQERGSDIRMQNRKN